MNTSRSYFTAARKKYFFKSKVFFIHQLFDCKEEEETFGFVHFIGFNLSLLDFLQISKYHTDWYMNVVIESY